MCKMLKNAFQLVFPALVYTCVALAHKRNGIYVEVWASSKASETNVNWGGEVKEVIPDEERSAWRLSDNQLKDYLMNYSGARPHDVLVKRPTPGNDLYTKHGWKQVERTLVPTSVKILDIVEADPQVLYTNYFYSKNSTATSYTVPSSHYKIVQKVSTTWTKNRELKIGTPISHGIKFPINDAFEFSHIKYKSKWGEDTTQSKTITISPNNTPSLKIIPGQDVETRVTLRSKILRVQINYRASLDGYVASNYNNQWSAKSIRDVLLSNNLPYTINSTEIIRIVYAQKLDVDMKLGLEFY